MVDLLGAGLVSLADLPECLVSGRALNLHMNRLRSTKGLRRFTELEELILSANAISEIRDLDHLGRLRVLDLSCNELRRLSGLTGLVALEELRLAYNRLETLEGLQQLWGKRYCLRVLDVRRNRVAAPAQLIFLGGCVHLQDVRFCDRGEDGASGGLEAAGGANIASNRVCTEPGYREAAIQAAPWLCSLDDEPVSPRERERSTRGSYTPAPSPPLQEEEPEEEIAEVTEADDAVGGGRIEAESEVQEVVADEETAESRLSPELIELARRMAGMAQELAHLQAPAGPPPEAVRRLQSEVLSELAALRHAEGIAEQLVDEERAQEQRQVSLRADLAEVAVHMQRREERHRATERELALASDAVVAVGTARAKEAEVLNGEEKRQAELEAQLSQEASLEASARSTAIDAGAALERAEAEEVMTSRSNAMADASLLRRELQRACEALQGARRRFQLQEASLPALSAALSENEARRRLATASLAVLRARAQNAEADARTWGREAAEEATQLATAAAQAAPRSWQRQAALAEEAASALRLRASLERVRTEAADCEQEASNLVAPGKLRDMVREVNDEHAQSESSLGQRAQRCAALRQKLQASLAEAEDAVACGRQRFGLTEQRLAQQQAAMSMADEQDDMARYILAELRLEVAQAKAGEQSQQRQAEELAHQSASEERAASRFEDDASAAQRETEQVRASIAQEHVPLAVHEQCLSQSCGLRKAVEALAERAGKGREAARASTGQLYVRKEELAELREAIANAERREIEVEQNIRLKGHMAADKRAHMDSLQLAMRRAEASQKEAHIALHAKLSEAAALGDERRELAEQIGVQVEEEREECSQWEAAVERKGEMVDFTEDQLQQLRAAQAGREEQARAQAAFLEAEGRRLLDEARGHALEMERRFRGERAGLGREGEELGAELAAARRRAAELPQALLAMRRRMNEDRARSMQLLAHLMAGLQS